MSQSFSQLKLDTILSKMGGSQKTASWNDFPHGRQSIIREVGKSLRTVLGVLLSVRALA